jgi:hypothetical protein
MGKIKFLIGLIGVFVVLQFTPLNLVSLYFSDEIYKQKINSFNNWKNKTVNNIKVNNEEIKRIIKEIEEEKINEKAFNFKKKEEKYNSTEEFSYSEIIEFEKDIFIFEKLNNIVNKVRSNMLILVFIYFLYLAWISWTPRR